ncbi:hypothetical protein HMPREF3038_02573, partial [Akkermansia sp. KLE1797]
RVDRVDRVDRVSGAALGRFSLIYSSRSGTDEGSLFPGMMEGL